MCPKDTRCSRQRCLPLRNGRMGRDRKAWTSSSHGLSTPQHSAHTEMQGTPGPQQRTCRHAHRQMARAAATVDVALAASAPILGYPGLSDEFGWNRVVTETFRSVCAAEGVPDAVELLRSGFSELATLSTAELSAQFKTCTPAKRPCDYQVLTEMVANFVGPAAESAYPPSRSPVVSACKTMVGAKTTLQAWTQLLAPGANETCLNVTWKP